MTPAAVNEKTAVGLSVVEGDAEAIRELATAGVVDPFHREIIDAAAEIVDAGDRPTQRAVLTAVESSPTFDASKWSDLGSVGTNAAETWSARAAVKAYLKHRRQAEIQDKLRAALEVADAGGDPSEILSSIDTEPTTTPDNRDEEFVSIDEIPLEPPEWIVRRFLEVESSASIVGKPGSWKSFLALSFGASVATGADWYGHVTRPGPVLYVAAEGQRGLRRRLKAWEIAHGTELANHPFLIRRRSASLSDPAAYGELAQKINRAAALTGSNPVLLILDTLNSNFGPGNESDTADMTAVVDTINRIRSSFGCSVLTLHHPPVNGDRRGRGSGANLGALDREYFIEKDESGIARLTAEKTKDDRPPEPMAFRFAEVDLGIVDDENEPVTSGVLTVVEYTDPRPTPATGKHQKRFLAELHRLESEAIANVTESGRDPDEARVTLDWIETELKGPARNCPDDKISAKYWQRTIDALLEKNLIVIDGPHIESADRSRSRSRSHPLKGVWEQWEHSEKGGAVPKREEWEQWEQWEHPTPTPTPTARNQPVGSMTTVRRSCFDRRDDRHRDPAKAG